MKTIMIVVGGMADCPHAWKDGCTPLMEADIPSLHGVAKVGCCGLVNNIPDRQRVSTETAILGLLGYDFDRGLPDADLLRALGAGHVHAADKIPWFVIPKFSGHGIVLTDNDLVRGIGVMALLRPAFTVRPDEVVEGKPSCGSLSDMAQAAVQAIDSFDFVLIYVDTPAQAARDYDRQAKTEALEEIDRELITPVADHVWNAKIQMNLVVVSDAPVSAATGRMERGDVPAAVYYNDDLPYDTERFDECSLANGPLNAPLPGELIKLLISFEPFDDDDKKQ